MFRLIDAPGYSVPTEPTDAAARIVNVLPFLTGKARRFRRSLPDRHRADHDIDDLIQDIWSEMLVKDAQYDPSRGSYITFAGTVIDRMFLHLADRLRRTPRPMPLEGDQSDDRTETPLETLAAEESARRAREALADALPSLDDRDHFVVTSVYGIDREPMTILALAAWLVTSSSMVIGIRSRAESNLRALLAGRRLR